MLEFNYSIILAQLINFGILYGVFKYFIADILNQRITERKEQLQKLRKAEEHYDEKMKLAEEQKQAMMKETRKTTKELMQEAEDIAKKKAQAIIARANSDVLAILDGGRREIEKERKSMLSQMKNHIVDVSMKLNKKMFWDQKMNKKFVEKELEEM